MQWVVIAAVIFVLWAVPSMSIPRGIRNNNPGNLRKTDIPWQGKVAGADPAFETFATPSDGIRAMAVTLLNYQRIHQLYTLRAIITRYAPPSENDTAAYISAVGDALGILPGESLDLNNPATLRALVTAMIQHEQGQQPYSPAIIAAAVNNAMVA